MNELRKQVRRAQWWLGVQRFLGVLGWCWLACLSLALGLVLADKYWPLGLPALAWPTGAIGLGLVAALVWAIARGRGPLDAAIELDRRFQLHERVSSSLALTPEEQQTQAGQALVSDALRRVERIEVAERFPIRPGRQILLPLLPAVMMVLVVLLVQPAAVENPAEGKTDPAAMKKQIEQSGQSLKRKLEQQRKKAESENLKDAKQLLQRLEEEAGKLGRQDQDRKQAMIKLNDLAQQLDKRQKELGGADKMQKQLNQLKDLGKGPADKFLNAVAKGDLKTAMQELEKLKQDLSKLSPQQRDELARQLDAMKQKLEKMVQQQKEAEEDLKKRIEQAKQAGQKEEAERLQEQLNKLQQQSTHLDRVQEMAKKLGQCSKCLQSGQTGQAGETLGDIGKDLDALQDQLEEFEMLDDAKSQIAQARDQMICPGCGGAGCGRCQGPPGQGLGTGKGYGDRPEEKDDDVDFFDSRASVKVGKGAASLAGEVEGPNVKGNAQQVVKEQFEAARRAPADPLTSERIPKKQRQHAKEYFDHLREGR